MLIIRKIKQEYEITALQALFLLLVQTKLGLFIPIIIISKILLKHDEICKLIYLVTKCKNSTFNQIQQNLYFCN